MEQQRGLLLLLGTIAALFASAGGNPVANNIPVQENFEEARFYGKWYGIALGTTCHWMRQYKERFNMGVLVVAPGKTSQEVSFTSTRLRQGACNQVTGDYQKTSIPGKLSYFNPKWKAHIESYIVRTNYDEFAFIVMKKNSTHGLTTTAKLYGRNPEVREGLLAEFRQFALDLGIPEDSIFTLINAGKQRGGEPCSSDGLQVPAAAHWIASPSTAKREGCWYNHKKSSLSLAKEYCKHNDPTPSPSKFCAYKSSPSGPFFMPSNSPN